MIESQHLQLGAILEMHKRGIRHPPVVEFNDSELRKMPQVSQIGVFAVAQADADFDRVEEEVEWAVDRSSTQGRRPDQGVPQGTGRSARPARDHRSTRPES